MFVSSGLDLTVMTDRDGHCSQLPSIEFVHPSTMMIRLRRCLISSLQVVRVQISFMQRSKLFVPR
jgi:hypothetical protein